MDGEELLFLHGYFYSSVPRMRVNKTTRAPAPYADLIGSFEFSVSATVFYYHHPF
jgi:hypothetical protein